MSETTPLADQRSWEERARAAEKTVAVLKAKVRGLYNGDGSALQRQLERARRRDEENRRKREVMLARTEELGHHKERLEAEVAARTRDIKTIVDNVTFGFLVVDRELRIRPGATASCRELFDKPEVEDVSLCELLELTDARGQADYELAVDQLYEDILPEELSLDQIPKRFALKNGHILRVEPRVVRNEQGDVDTLLMTVSDVTALEEAQREAQANRVLVSLLKQRDAFRMFLAEVRDLLAIAGHAAQRCDEATARRALHTMKGNAGSYGLTEVASTIHDVEAQTRISPTSVDSVEQMLRAFLERNEAVLEIDFDDPQLDHIEISGEQLRELRQIAVGVHGATAEQLHKWTKQVLMRPASMVLGPVDEFVERLASRLGKSARVVLEGGDVAVDPAHLRPVTQNLTHVLRNAIDHGLEGPDCRGAKPETGTIRIGVSETEDAYQLEVSDDGRGIDIDRVVHKALEKGVVTDADLAGATDDEKLSLVFVDGVSTAETATEISGRGVGMSALKAEVDARGGQIEIHSELGQGTRIRVVVPKRGGPNSIAPIAAE